MSQRLRLASVNVNGIRAAYRKGMGEWLADRDVDVLTLQEVRATTDDLEGLLGPEWNVIHHPATAKGRAGVAIASRGAAVIHRVELGPDDFDSAGRWIEADYDVDGTIVTVVSTYVHSGEVGTEKQDEKWRFLDAMSERLPQLAAHSQLAVVTGDLNVGHRELDIKNWKGNVKRAGFLPRERAYFDRFFGEAGQPVETVDGSGGTGLGWVDVGRRLSGEVEGPYSWWSWRGQAFDNDTGWRIDYHVATPALAERASGYTIDRAASYDKRWSDHAPVVVDYDI
ncbi:exodeoxyribonuclease III [Frigoribacterium sp. CFBP 8754]|uniref:exodeoxyribonuclease III n=1 Tax=Frigoribacterium sp. CFBP 8754 TaxID=2775290 RepID=UPI00177A7C23|nr:exodeoxyribonuclease III [Frigoribacterium sp. CFBP 8754]MBD8658948.1 exodeoxyribonuclease III [Frigoribacterium sp. CFBP 8754]